MKPGMGQRNGRLPVAGGFLQKASAVIQKIEVERTPRARFAPSAAERRFYGLQP